MININFYKDCKQEKFIGFEVPFNELDRDYYLGGATRMILESTERSLEGEIHNWSTLIDYRIIGETNDINNIYLQNAYDTFKNLSEKFPENFTVTVDKTKARKKMV